MAAAGLWTTPTDLARFAIEIALSARGRANHVLSPGMAREILSPQFPKVGEPTWGDASHPDRMGLGFFLGDSYEDRGAGWDESPSVFLRDAREHEVRDGDPLARVDRDHGALTGIAEEDEGGRKAFVVADVPESIRRARRSTILRSPLR